MGKVFSVLLLTAAFALSGFLIVDSVRTLWLREPAPRPASAPPEEHDEPEQPAEEPPAPPQPLNVATVPQRERSQPDAAAPVPPAEPPRPVECDARVRVSGNAYVPGTATPLVMFSGPDVRRRGLRSVGGRVAGKTVVAIYPQAVVLRDAEGRDCWLKMSSAHAREVLHAERQTRARRIADVQREKQREERRKRAAERRAKKKAKR